MSENPLAPRTGWLADLTAFELRERLDSGKTRAGEVADAFLQRIAEREEAVGAFAFFDAAIVRAQAKAAQTRRESGRPTGTLNGLPVGIKDIIDTSDMPTENGSAVDSGRRPKRDATIVTRLRAAGAVIAGKTVTAELAFLTPGKTRNPHDPSRTPGGSSSGSAAAVAAGMVPLAIGTQTNGSVIRPASFCGVVGFKPTHGLIPRTGVLTVSRQFDTIGMFGRSVEDVALLADAMVGYDPADPDTVPAAAPDLLRIATSKPPVRPSFAFVPTPVWDKAAPETKDGFHELVAALGGAAETVNVHDVVADAHPLLRTIMLAGMARSFAHYYDHGREALSPAMQAAIEEGRAITAADYLKAVDWRIPLNGALDRIFDRCDAILTPAATGEAPIGLETTGDPAFCTIWSYCGLPAISLPLLHGPNGLPVGVQVVGRAGDDARLLRTARWLSEFVANPA